MPSGRTPRLPFFRPILNHFSCNSSIFLLALAALVFVFAPSTSHAQCGTTYNCVTSFTLSPSQVTGGSQEFASGSIQITRVPGSSGSVPVVINGTSALYLQCADGNLSSGAGCYVPSNTTTFKLWITSVVSADTNLTMSAAVQYSADPGVTQPLTVKPFQVTATVPRRL